MYVAPATHLAVVAVGTGAIALYDLWTQHPSIQREGYLDRTSSRTYATNYFRAVVVPKYALEYFALLSSIKNRPFL